MTDLTGQVLGGRYRVEAFLGSGGMASVYKVFDQQRAVPLALKVLKDNLAEDQVFIRRFLHEARTLELLQHPNIVRFYGLEETDRHAYILMDFIDGLTLRREIPLHKSGMHPERILEVMQPVCAALYYAHQLGMVHCDIKPDNIMVHRNGVIYLTDFGIARMTEASTQAAAGTPAYMAPEQLLGHEPTPAADIYALGVVLYEMATGGQRPFNSEHAETPRSVAKKILWAKQNIQAPAPSRTNPSISAELETVILRCLEREPDRRYSSTLDLLHALKTAIRGPIEEDESQTLTGIFDEEEDALPETPGDYSPPSQAQPSSGSLNRKKRWPVAWIAAAAAGLMLAAIGLTMLPAFGKAPNGTPTALYAAGATSTLPTQPAISTTVVSTAVASAAVTAQPSATAPLPPSPTPTAEPTPIGGSGQIAFASTRSGAVQVWLIDLEHPEDRVKVTDLPGGACQPAWSPDGTQIAFTTPCRGPSVYYPGSTIKILHLADKTITDLLEKSAGAFDPAWSPDGKTILYTAIIGENTVIRAVDLETKKSRVLANRGVRNAQPAWSRDGKWIVYLSTDDLYRDALWQMRPDGDSHELLDHSVLLSEPAWSPNGKHILLSQQIGSSAPKLVLFDRANPKRGLAPLLSGDYRMSHGSFSPDGNWVVFWTEDSRSTPKIMLGSVTSKRANQFFESNARDFQPAWKP